ncbi:MAG: hypothetical protein FE78DRAFT_81504 [Acidomyces sp. 'richmondensis']|nr:MAG: hypothetical protein FE78DRAFT_81504 [Acidomyces sp. 'richmondensis']
MDSPNDFAALQSSITSALVSTTRTASQLAAEDVSFHCSLDATLGRSIDQQNARLLSLAERLLGAASSHAGSLSSPLRLTDMDSVDGNWRAIVDVVDSLLERADTALDEFTGAVKRMSTPETEQAAVRPRHSGRVTSGLRTQEMDKPQLLFEQAPTNYERGPFKPLLTTKPHAVQPLVQEPVVSGAYSEELQYPHPYQQEIEQYRYPAKVYTAADPILYRPFDATAATFVDTEESMYEMLEELKQASEIAVDLEHHDQRSYIGIVCLMQISTRDKDWIIDTLKPWRRKLECLNEVFANPNILKVLHGAYMDVVWLQRDLGLYLVGLFDTHHAARALGYPGGSYAYLLKRFTKLDAQKQFQMADWRVRPLPQELVDYARSDTHYLLYIYDHMRNELISKSNFSMPDHAGDKLNDVLAKSSEVALQRYEHPIYDYELGQGPAGWYKLLAKTPALLSKRQFSVFRAVHKWRDDVAREQDDSVHYVMPNHQIFSLAKAMPTNKADVLASTQPTSQTVRLRVDELSGVIQKAKEEGGQGPEMMDVMKKIEPQLFAGRSSVIEQPVPSIVNIVSRTDQTSSANGVVTLTPQRLRSETSAFWGPVLLDAPRTGPTSKSIAINLTVPLPPLTAEIFADPTVSSTTPSKASASTSSSPTPYQDQQAEAQEDIFILKQLGKKRKQPVSPQTLQMDNMAAQSDEVELAGDEHFQQKVESKRLRKAARRAKKAAEAATGKGLDATQRNPAAEEEPFDYASAPSILQPPKESKEETKARKKKEVNPYAKALDAPKGLPRVQRERPGRTMTYKS